MPSASRVVAAMAVLVLVLSIEGVVPTDAAGGGSSVAALRQGQRRAEAAMDRADKQIRRLKTQRAQHHRRFDGAKRTLEQRIRQRDAARRAAERARQRLSVERDVLRRTLRVRPSPSGRQVVDRPALRKRVRTLAVRSDRLERKVERLVRKVDRARDRKQQRAKRVGRSRIQARKQDRERAEMVLAGRITSMLALAKVRADSRFGPASATGFRKPARGRVSQDYGCQQTRKVKGGRRTCVRFHDGIDIATARGAVVRAAADGYVAYVGRNPWDKGKRAFVVIIGHARGYETIYAHLKPTRKVRAGQRVERGQVIGQVGLTGRTTGSHVHWEVSRGFRTIDPRRAGGR